MNSMERRDRRYLNRRKLREEKKILRNEDASYENVISFDNLAKAYYKARKQVSWKASVQRYEASLMRNTYNLHSSLKNKTFKSKGFIEFDTIERGKKRHIMSVHISERCVQKSLCDNALVPVVSKSLIYDNGASLKGRGTDFALNRLCAHLEKHYRKYGNEGYVLVGDLHDFFGSINHGQLYGNLKKWFTDKDIIQITKNFIEPFGEKGLGLGSQVSQILAVSCPNQIDHYIKEKLKISGYGRYMDDFYLLNNDKAYLQECLAEIRELYASIGISLNEKKTKIVKLSKGFEFLKTKVFLTDTGRIVKKVCRDNVVRMCRKLKKMKIMLDNGEITYPEIRTAYASWSGYIQHKDAYITKKNMDALYNQLFIDSFRGGCEYGRTA